MDPLSPKPAKKNAPAAPSAASAEKKPGDLGLKPPSWVNRAVAAAKSKTGSGPDNTGPMKAMFSLLGLIMIGGFGFYFLDAYVNSAADMPDGWTQVIRRTAIPPAGAFAVREPVTVDVKPLQAAYNVKADLSDVPNVADFSLSDGAKTLLAKNLFVVTPGWEREFFPLYERNRYNQLPNFVTVDSVVHNYHLMFNHLLEQLEKGKLADQARTLSADLLRASQAQYQTLRGTAWDNAARRNIGFFAVAARLLDPTSEIPVMVEPEVVAELELIEKHGGIRPSPVMNMGLEASLGAPPALGDEYLEDYSQYVPRGHYEKSEQLRAYFKAMMWYGRLTFRFKNDDEVRSAALMTAALDNKEVLSGWDSIYEPIGFFVGQSDDVTFYQMRGALQAAYGEPIGVRRLADDAAKFDVLKAELAKLAPPQINSIPIFDESISPDREKEIKGFRFLGQRFTVDASIFQRLVYRDVKENPEGQRRMLPMSLDIPAALGSEEALSILENAKQAEYQNYPENMSRLRGYLGGLNDEVWTQDLYWGWLFALRPLLQPKGAGWPSFMTNEAWTRKDLNTFLASWTELKHDTILYAKQVYAELGGGPGEIPKRDDRGYVEPEPVAYARLASLTGMTKRGLEARKLIGSQESADLDLMNTLLLKLKIIAEKELSGEKISDDEYELIRSFGGQLEHLWSEINKEELEAAQMSRQNFLDQNPAALVADVATNPNGQVLEEGTGSIANIYAIVPVDGKLKVVSGGVFSYYEFPWPLNDRLTDTKWRDMLDSGQAPAPPEWTGAFVAR